MKRTVLFLALAFFYSNGSIFPDAAVGQNYSLSFVDVDGNSFSTADGHITTVVLTNQSGIDKTRAVGDRTPDFCLGNPTYRMPLG